MLVACIETAFEQVGCHGELRRVLWIHVIGTVWKADVFEYSFLDL